MKLSISYSRCQLAGITPQHTFPPLLWFAFAGPFFAWGDGAVRFFEKGPKHCLHKGEKVHIWSNSKNAWMTDGVVVEAPQMAIGGDVYLPLGAPQSPLENLQAHAQKKT